jgi:mono/diheme cytochrome c family protein
MTCLRKSLCRGLQWLIFTLSAAAAVRAAEPFEAFVEKHCLRCHGPQGEEAGLRIDRLSRDFAVDNDTHRWAEVLERVNSGEMPPAKEPRPTQDEIAAFVTGLNALLKEGRAARMAARAPVSHYRLSRKEYQNTVYDLLGIHYDPTKPGELNEDTRWHGYERIGSELSLSPSHVDRYYRAATQVLDRAFSTQSVETRKVRKTAAELRYRGGVDAQQTLDRLGIKRPLRLLLASGAGAYSSPLTPQWFGKIGPEHSGRYRMRMQASGIRPPGGQLPHLHTGIELDITAPEDSPQIYEAEVFLETPTGWGWQVVSNKKIPDAPQFENSFGRRAYVFTHSSETLTLNPNSPQVFDDKGNAIFPVVIVDWVEWEGPLVSEEEKSRRKEVILPDDATPEVVAAYLQRFAERAWRRPVSEEELEVYLVAFRSERDAGAKPADAYRAALQGVLTSRNFIYLVDGDPEPRERVNDWEYASRLSYFLWSSMPDERLFAAARAGTLTGAGRGSEVDRMLADGKIDRFVDDFSRQWLQLHRLGMFPPDKSLYPVYDRWLETSLRREPVEFFRETFSRNLPVDSFIDSDWTTANARLCDFYGLAEPPTSDFQRVKLDPAARRGGLLTMGGVLGLTSDGTRHRPVHRGVWLSEVVFGKTPPPPPANVPAIEPPTPQSPKATLREKIEAHRNDANCAACHAKIDPLGIAWDNYDAIGQWRTHEKVAAGVGADPEIDPSGVLPDGRSFHNPNDFKRLLLEDRERIARAFIEHLCTYALRRVLTVDDDDAVTAIVAEARKCDYRVKDMVRAVALSELLMNR